MATSLVPLGNSTGSGVSSRMGTVLVKRGGSWPSLVGGTMT